MSVKNFVHDLKDIKENIGNLSQRTFGIKISGSSRVRSQSIVLDAISTTYSGPTSCWANLPPELLRDVLRRIESEEGSWPTRKDVVACSAVCRTWRKITQELVKAPEVSGKLTFPINLKQPGPKETPMQCFIRRDRANSMFYLYLGLSSSLIFESCKFLLAARRVPRATGTDYLISLNAEDMSKSGSNYVGKLRSNFLGTKFNVYDSDPPLNGAVVPTSRACRRISSKKVSPKVPACDYNVVNVAYELNVIGTRGPRRMQCTLNSIPTSVVEINGCFPAPMELPIYTDGFSSSMSLCRPFSDVLGLFREEDAGKFRPLILKNKAPRWHEQLQCWCLNFRGRVTVASVKNFQLVPAMESGPTTFPQNDLEKVILQFGKIGKDIFTMDYLYPLSAFQAFAICLSSFDTKFACE